ncbi:Bystin [Vitis vinifera]|uniref:Bystin n=1 Tax=Vitis vinifera TaxID=29760 RepID=A0A438HS44_VITVI|nr:Bystin [Vitis vinifera]
MRQSNNRESTPTVGHLPYCKTLGDMSFILYLKLLKYITSSNLVPLVHCQRALLLSYTLRDDTCCIIEACRDGVLWHNKVVKWFMNWLMGHEFACVRLSIAWSLKLRFGRSLTCLGTSLRIWLVLFPLYFIKLLLDKKYALPYRAVDAVVAHFIRFIEDTRIMPVIWHQSLLTFVQRYKNQLRKEDKDSLKTLIENQRHRLVTPDISRELNNSRNRGEKEDDLMLIYIL